jgi:hypothetical protein
MSAKGKSKAKSQRKRVRDRTRQSAEDEYDVGYKKPPKSGQIKPGERRNPNGRPKGSRNFNTILRQLMEKPMTLTIDGQKIKVSGREAIAYRVFQKAVAGDAKCIEILRSIDHEFELELMTKQAQKHSETDVSSSDKAILSDFLKSMKNKGGKNEN